MRGVAISSGQWNCISVYESQSLRHQGIRFGGFVTFSYFIDPSLHTMTSSSLINPLATPAQLSTSSSSLDSVRQNVESAAIYVGACLTQSAGILLRLPQDVIARAIILFTRFWTGPEGGSLKEVGAAVRTPLFLNEYAKGFVL